MNRSSVLLIGGFLVFMGPAAPVAAQSNAPNGFYVGAGLGQSKFEDGCKLLVNAPPLTCDHYAPSWKLMGGYAFNPTFALELGYWDFGRVKQNHAAGTEEIAATAFELSGVLTGRFSDWSIFSHLTDLSYFARVGGYRSTMEASGLAKGSKVSQDFMYGFGVQYDFTRRFGVRGEFQRFFNAEASVERPPNVGFFGTTGATDITVLGVHGLWRFQ